MSRSSQTAQKQVEAKRSVRRLRAKHLYAVHTRPLPESKEKLRSLAEQALAEWQNKNQHRVPNLSDYLRRIY